MNLRTFARCLGTLTLFGVLAACGDDNSTPAPPPIAAITAQPADQSVVAGTAATFSVVASNASGYQWQSSTDGGTSFTNVSAATTASHTTAASTLLDSGMKYRVVVAGVGNSVTSSAANLTVTAAVVVPSISVQLAAQTTTAGQNASFSVTASGTSLVYQWQRSTDGGASFADMAGESNATLTLTAVALADNAQKLRVVVSNSAGSVTSAATTLTVNAASVAAALTLHPSNQSVTAPAVATFTAAAVGTPTPTLQWQVNATGSWGDIIGATGNSYTTPPTIVGDSGKQYRVMATNATANVTSTAASLTVSLAPVAPSFTIQPLSVTITAGQSTQFTVAVSGTPAPTLQWQLSMDSGVNWSNVTGETGAVFNVVNAAQGNDGRQFRAVASNGVGPAVNSNAAVLTVTFSSTMPLAFGKISAGESHTCAVKADAAVACWGKNSSGEVLPGVGFDQDIPVTVPGLTGITQVAVGFQRSCALNALGNLLCWGKGNGTGVATLTDSANVPYTGIKAIALGSYHTCFIDANTTVQCLGDDSMGQLGQGSVSTTPAVNPVTVRRLGSFPLTGAVSLAAGYFYTCALKSDGEVVCWGSGAIGDGTPLALRAVVPAVTGAIAVASGGGHVCAAMGVGGIKCWGDNSSGQLGNGIGGSQLVPVSVFDPQGLLSGVSRIAMEAKNTCAVRANPANGQVICWGSVSPNNINGGYTPPTAKGSSTQLISAISGGWEHTCALLADGSMECWGGNLFGQLGIGGTIGVFSGGPTPPVTSVVGGAIFWK